ncbi:MAG TPA: carboxypeptidase regulatory-like domain-containing protein, partial [Pyrinomonadaceae bacterium]|nr:carboxypeptidase regulatory-like domain-containing protein [Pyrinomonadaceae bacterium]
MQNFLPRSLVSLALIALALSLSLKAGFVPLVRVGAQNVKRTPASRAATHTQGEADDGDGTVRPYTGGGLFISEYRLEGPNGATDEFIEIYNDENSPVTVNAPSSTGYALVASDGVVRCILPNNTVIPSRGHYLCANSNGYSLNNYPAGSNMTAIPDASYTTDIPLNSGIALFNTANPVDFTLANRIDAVGTTSAPTLYREGAGHPVISSTTTEFSLFRLLDATGTPQDTDDNETDFLIADTQGTNLCTSTANFKCQRLGAPGPENLTSPTFTPGTISISLLDPAAAATAPPNQITDSIPDPANNATFGSLLYRRKITNNTGQPLTRLRFRVKKLSTFPPSTGEADLRLRTITDTTANTSNGPVFVEGTTLETPPAQPNGGGYNSTVVVGSISAANPLPPGASINVQFLLGIQQTGTYTFETDFGQISAPPTTITASNTNDSGAGSLRQAILDANAQPGTQTIAFNIGSGLQTINLLSALPTITDPLIIDGTTQPGYSGTPLIELNGLSTGVVSGLVITSGNSQVKGLIINRFSNLGIILQTGGGNIVEGNFIGTNAAGTATLGNNSNGVGIIDSANNTIGGTAAAARNVISGNGGDGIGISGASSTGNIIQGNFIGTDAAGTSAIPNARSAVAIGGASNNVVGGTSAGARNVLSGNTQNGVIIFSGGSGTSIQGNFIGTNASGTAGLPNGGEGIFVMGGSSNNTIGGTTAAARNIISGNNSNGISFRDNGTNNNAVVGNYIGTDVSGTASIRNLFAGIVFGNNATGNTVGGTAAGAGNVISGNSGTGVQIGVFGSGPGGGITVQGNLIGTNAAGTAALGNGGYGVSVDNTPNNQIGGTAAGARNVISGNTFVNVYIIGANAAGNTVAGNYVGTNAAGTSGLGGSGVLLGNGANNNTVGGTTAAARNVVSGNAANGVALGGGDNNVSTNNRVQGNYIGLNAAGTAVVTNTFSGVSLTGTGATNNLIGGTAAGAGNVIAGNSHQAVAILNGASGNTIQGNFMGTDATGNTGLGGEGVFIGGGSSNNLIGGTTAAARNVMSGNTGAAVSINDFNGGGATNNRVEGNFIGVNPAGTNAVPNGGGGIIINNVSGNTVGGLAAGAGNVIANNTPFGVRINSGSANAILSNSIFNNGDAGIGLTNGGNDSQAAPVLTAAMNVSGTMTITGTLTSTPNSSFTVQFFSNAACDASGSGEGQTFLGTTSVTTSAGGTAPISFVAGNVPAGQLITATATSAANSTSQFSACRIVTSQDFTISGRITDPAGNGLSDVTVTLSGAGAQNVKTDANGNYSFVVVGGQSYTVTPTSPYFVFTPLRADFANIASSQAANFSVVPTATPTPTPPLQDDFNAAQRDPDKWNLGTLTQPAAAFDPQVSVTQQSGQ